jgi:hypothetical protein
VSAGSGDAPATPEQLSALGQLIDQWAAAERERNELFLNAEYQPEDRRWIVRLRGEEKAIIAVWLTLRERTLHYESYFMPAPEENIPACFEYLLRVNARLFAVRFAIGIEDAVFLLGQLPVTTVDEEQLDRIVGSIYAYSEQYFPSAMSIGFESRYRRPPH